jgi:hypothetical protein
MDPDVYLEEFNKRYALKKRFLLHVPESAGHTVILHGPYRPVLPGTF